MPFPHDHTRLIRWALLANGVVCAFVGGLLLTGAPTIAGMFGWSATPFGMPGADFFRSIALLQFVLSALAIVAAFRQPFLRPLGVFFTVLNLVWFALSWVILLIDLLMTTMGITILAVQSAVVLALALAEYAGLRALRRPAG